LKSEDCLLKILIKNEKKKTKTNNITISEFPKKFLNISEYTLFGGTGIQNEVLFAVLKRILKQGI
jgi:hypothetical protein